MADTAPVRLPVKVVPNASRSAIAGWLGDELKVRVAQPPEKNRANREVEALLGAALGLPVANVRVVRGHTSPRKLIEIDGLTMPELRQRLDRLLA